MKVKKGQIVYEDGTLRLTCPSQKCGCSALQPVPDLMDFSYVAKAYKRNPVKPPSDSVVYRTCYCFVRDDIAKPSIVKRNTRDICLIF